MKIDIHKRTVCHALDKVMALKNDAVHRAHIQHYLTHWTSWWHKTSELQINYLLGRWVSFIDSFYGTMMTL